MKSILVFLIGVLSAVLVMQIYYHNKDREVVAEADNPYDRSYEATDFYEPELVDFIIDPELNLETHNSTNVPIASLAGDSTIFIRYSTHGCALCIRTLFHQLNQFYKNNNGKKAIFLIKNISNRELYVNWVAHDKKYPMYKCDSIPTDTVLDEDALYLFQLNQDGTIRDHFVCQYGDTVFVNKFLNRL